MMRIFIATLAMVVAWSGQALADGAAKEKWPSITYYGEGTNNRVEGALYWEGQQGRLADEAKRREKSGSYSGQAPGYGAISSITGNARTNYVTGYTRSNGVSVSPYYRSTR